MKRKLPGNYVKEYPEFEAAGYDDFIDRKFSRVQVSTAEGKDTVRITEHRCFVRHIQLKRPRVERGEHI